MSKKTGNAGRARPNGSLTKEQWAAVGVIAATATAAGGPAAGAGAAAGTVGGMYAANKLGWPPEK